jgi:hypothetical protein
MDSQTNEQRSSGEKVGEVKIEQFWRDATAQDAENGKGCVARFRDHEKGKWFEGQKLTGWRRKIEDQSLVFYDGAGVSWRQCQVYEPPQWWLDKPDPGEGYRLLEKFPHEDLEIGDECQFTNGEWGASYQAKNGRTQVLAMWYRRRIEAVKQDAGSTCASNIPKGWTALLLDEPRLASDAFWSVGAKDWVIIDERRVEYANRDKWPAIRQVENWRCMQLMEGCFYRLPNGQGIKVTKQGFELQ